MQRVAPGHLIPEGAPTNPANCSPNPAQLWRIGSAGRSLTI